MSAGIFRMRREAAEQAIEAEAAIKRQAEQLAAEAAQAEQAYPMSSARAEEPLAGQPEPLNKETAAAVAKPKPKAPPRAA
jgi:hypothetical protein